MNKSSKETSFDEIIDRRVVPALKVHPMVVGDGGENLFAAGVADMDFKAPAVIRDALQYRLDHGIFGYETVPSDLLPALTDWLAARHSWRVEQHHILRAPNVLNILAIAASLLTNPGDRIIVQPPVFFDFYDIIKENHRNLIPNPLVLANGRYQMNFDDLELKASDPRTKLLFLCNPHNPVGRVWTARELRTLGDICAKHGVLVVADEIHGDITFTNHRYTPFASLGSDYAQNCITCLSPAKSFNIAACCSAFTVIANEKLRQAFQIENSRLTLNKNNAFASAAMQAAYRSGEPWLEEVSSYIEQNMKLVQERLAELSGVTLIEPEGTFLLWLDFQQMGLPPQELTTFLKSKANWAVTRGEAFGTEGTGFARLNIACPRTKLASALDQLNAAITAFNAR